MGYTTGTPKAIIFLASHLCVKKDFYQTKILCDLSF